MKLSTLIKLEIYSIATIVMTSLPVATRLKKIQALFCTKDVDLNAIHLLQPKDIHV